MSDSIYILEKGLLEEAICNPNGEKLKVLSQIKVIQSYPNKIIKKIRLENFSEHFLFFHLKKEKAVL